MTGEIQDPNIWRCTYKKSISVVERLMVLVAWAIDITAAFFIIGASLYYTLPVIFPVVIYIMSNAWNLSGMIFGFVFSVFLSIPWYIYLILLVPAAIIGYSYAWCVARNLTEDDWVEGKKSGNSLWITSTLVAVMGFIFFVFLAIISEAAENSEITKIFALLSLIMVIIFAMNGLLINRTNDIYGFFGAYRHYKKRIKL